MPEAILRPCGLHLTHDYDLLLGTDARCRVRVYLSEDDRDAPVVLLNEPLPNPASPVLESASDLAANVCRERSPEFIGRPEPVFIQYNEARGSFYLLVLPDGRLVGPRWKSLDRRTVENLVGEAL